MATNGVGGPQPRITHISPCPVIQLRDAGSLVLSFAYARCLCPAQPKLHELVPENLGDNPRRVYLDFSGHNPGRYGRGSYIQPRSEPTKDVLAGLMPTEILAPVPLRTTMECLEASDLSEDGVRVCLAVLQVEQGRWTSYTGLPD